MTFTSRRNHPRLAPSAGRPAGGMRWPSSGGVAGPALCPHSPALHPHMHAAPLRPFFSRRPVSRRRFETLLRPRRVCVLLTRSASGPARLGGPRRTPAPVSPGLRRRPDDPGRRGDPGPNRPPAPMLAHRRLDRRGVKLGGRRRRRAHEGGGGAVRGPDGAGEQPGEVRRRVAAAARRRQEAAHLRAGLGFTRRDGNRGGGRVWARRGRSVAPEKRGRDAVASCAGGREGGELRLVVGHG